MALQIYGYPISTYTQRVFTVLNEKGINASFTEIDLFKGEHKAADYVARVHPFAKVPVLVDHETGLRIFGRYKYAIDWLIWRQSAVSQLKRGLELNVSSHLIESRAIAQYIASKYRGQGTELSPPETDLERYALYQQALSIESSYIDPLARAIVWEKIFKAKSGLGPADQRVVKSSLEELDTVLQGYERVLSKNKYLAGAELTLADLFHLPYGILLEDLGFTDLLSKYPKVTKWWEVPKLAKVGRL